MFPAIFLDRDGVLIENRPDYVRRWADVSIYPQALKALARIRHTGYKIVIVTNQSCVGRGLVAMEVARDINRRLVTEIERAGGRIDDVRMCPHAPELGCACRKPEPGLLLEAAHSLSLDLGRSILIGDALSDLQAGRAAGVAQVVLVRTGRGKSQARLPLATELKPFLVFRSLEEALEALVPREAESFN